MSKEPILPALSHVDYFILYTLKDCWLTAQQIRDKIESMDIKPRSGDYNMCYTKYTKFVRRVKGDKFKISKAGLKAMEKCRQFYRDYPREREGLSHDAIVGTKKSGKTRGDGRELKLNQSIDTTEISLSNDKSDTWMKTTLGKILCWLGYHKGNRFIRAAFTSTEYGKVGSGTTQYKCDRCGRFK